MDRSKKLIEKIKKEDIKPLPRWRFTLRNTLIITGFIIAVLLGGLAFSIVLFAIQQTDFNLVSHLSHSALELFLGILPIVWIVLLIVALLLAMYGIRHSRRGYKFTLARQLGFSVALSILLGTLFFITGGAQRLERAFDVHLSIYESINEKKINLWMHPEEGRLAGRIEQVRNGMLQLTDFNGKSWRVEYDESTFIPPVVLLEIGEQVKLLGEKLNGNRFDAKEIRPWEGPGRRGQGPGGPGRDFR